MTERHPRGILDTSTFVQLTKVDDTASLPHEPLITTVTLAELSVGPLLATSGEEQARRQAHLQESEADFDPLPLDADAARAFARVAASLRSTGRKPTARSFDAIIALAHQLPVYTCNAEDFAGIDDLVVVDVPVDADRAGRRSAHSRRSGRSRRAASPEAGVGS